MAVRLPRREDRYAMSRMGDTAPRINDASDSGPTLEEIVTQLLSEGQIAGDGPLASRQATIPTDMGAGMSESPGIADSLRADSSIRPLGGLPERYLAPFGVIPVDQGNPANTYIDHRPKVASLDPSAGIHKGFSYIAPATGEWAPAPQNYFHASRGYDTQKNPRGREHSGNDIRAPKGSPAVAMIGGKVIYAGQNAGYNWNAVVLGNDGNAYRYATHGPLAVKLNQVVNQGDKIGTIDANTPGGMPHLHFEVIPPTIDGKPNAAFQQMVKNGELPAAKNGLSQPGAFVSTQFWPSRNQPAVTINPAQFFGVSYGDNVVAGKAFGDPAKAAVVTANPMEVQDPFGVGASKDGAAVRPVMYGLRGLKATPETDAAMKSIAESQGYRYEPIAAMGGTGAAGRKAQVDALTALAKPGETLNVVAFSAGVYAARDAAKQGVSISRGVFIGGPGVEGQFPGVNATFIPDMPNVDHMKLPQAVAQSMTSPDLAASMAPAAGDTSGTNPRLPVAMAHDAERMAAAQQVAAAGGTPPTLTVADRNAQPQSTTDTIAALNAKPSSPPAYASEADRVFNDRFANTPWASLPDNVKQTLTQKLGPGAQQKYEATQAAAAQARGGAGPRLPIQTASALPAAGAAPMPRMRSMASPVPVMTPTKGGTPASQIASLLTTGRQDIGVAPLPAHVAAGAVGNMMQEAYPDLRPNALGAAGERGIGQWDKTRYAAMEQWTKANGLDPNSREGQALFYSHELQTRYPQVMDRLAQVKTPGEAAKIIASGYELAGNPQMNKRMAYAEQIGGGAPTGTAAPVSTDLPAGRPPTIGVGTGKTGAPDQWTSFLQQKLKDALPNTFGDLAVDGVYGPQTKAAVQTFSRHTGDPIPNGVAGTHVWGTLAKMAPQEGFGPFPRLRPDTMATGPTETGFPLQNAASRTPSLDSQGMSEIITGLKTTSPAAVVDASVASPRTLPDAPRITTRRSPDLLMSLRGAVGDNPPIQYGKGDRLTAPPSIQPTRAQATGGSGWGDMLVRGIMSMFTPATLDTPTPAAATPAPSAPRLIQPAVEPGGGSSYGSPQGSDATSARLREMALGSGAAATEPGISFSSGTPGGASSGTPAGANSAPTTGAGSPSAPSSSSANEAAARDALQRAINAMGTTTIPQVSGFPG